MADRLKYLNFKGIIQNEIYKPSFIVAKECGLNSLVLAKITSACHVQIQDQRVNIGLGFKFEARKRKVLGYSRKNDKGWEFSKLAIAIIKEYKEKFPMVFKLLEKKSVGDFYQLEDFLTISEGNNQVLQGIEYIKSITHWLSTLEVLNSVDVNVESCSKVSFFSLKNSKKNKKNRKPF